MHESRVTKQDLIALDRLDNRQGENRLVSAFDLLASHAFSWLSDLLEKLKELVSMPEQPVLVPIPVRNRPRRPPPVRR